MLAKQIEGLDIVIKAKTGAKDRLYGSITNADIAGELNKSAGLEVDKRKIELEKPIHEIGSYEIDIRLTKDIIPKIKLSVIEEEGTEGEEKKETKAGKKGTKRKKATKAEKVVEEAETEEQEEKVAAEAEAEVPRAMAEAFRGGNLGVMDYYRIRNIQADTDMRTSISGSERDEGRSDS